MTEGEPGKGAWGESLGFRRLWDMVPRIAKLDESVTSLRNANAAPHREVLELQKQVAAHDAQLRLLTAFVRDSLNNRLEAKIEKLATELLAGRNKKT